MSSQPPGRINVLRGNSQPLVSNLVSSSHCFDSLTRTNSLYFFFDVAGFPIYGVSEHTHFRKVQTLQFDLAGNTQEFEGSQYFEENIAQSKDHHKNTDNFGELRKD